MTNDTRQMTNDTRQMTNDTRQMTNDTRQMTNDTRQMTNDTRQMTNVGRAALAWGPFVLAYDQARNPGLPPVSAIGLVRESTELTIQPGPSLAFRGPRGVGRKGDRPSQAVFVPFADAGSTGGDYRVWLRSPRRGCQHGVGPGRRPRELVAAGKPERLDHRWRPVQFRGHVRWIYPRRKIGTP